MNHKWLACTLGNVNEICIDCRKQLKSFCKVNKITYNKKNELHLITVFNTLFGKRISYHCQSKAWAKKNGRKYHQEKGATK